MGETLWRLSELHKKKKYLRGMQTPRIKKINPRDFIL